MNHWQKRVCTGDRWTENVWCGNAREHGGTGIQVTQAEPPFQVVKNTEQQTLGGPSPPNLYTALPRAISIRSLHSAIMSSVEEERCPFYMWCPCSTWSYTSASLWNTPVPEDSFVLIRWTVSFMKTWTRSTPATTNTKHIAGISQCSKVYWDIEEGRPERKDTASLTYSEMQRLLCMEMTLMIAELLISYQVGTF